MTTTTNILRSVIRAKGVWVVVGLGGTILTSTNGVEWQSRSLVNDPVDLYGITYAKGQFVAVGNRDFRAAVFISSDAESWRPADRIMGSPEAGNLKDVIYVAEKDAYVAVGNGTVIVSSDGVNWNQLVSRLDMAPLGNASAVSYGNNIFVAAGGFVYTSTNAQDWVQETISPTQALLDVTSVGNAFWAVGTGSDGAGHRVGVVAYSPDGHIWSDVTSVEEPYLFALAPVGKRLLAVGQRGTILLSPELLPNFSAARMLNNGDFLLTISGYSTVPVAVDFSDDFRSWQPLQVLFNLTGTTNIVDSSPNTSSQRFYRASW